MRIVFHKIRWTNFLSTGSYWTELDLSNNSTTLICGENGSGKSTFMDALCFCLYGKPFRKINKPQLVNSIIGKNMSTEIEFSVGTNLYKIVRGLKPGIFEVYVNDVMLSQNAEQKDYQEILEKNILRMNYKTFCQIVILGSANFVPFMQLPSLAKREFIEDLLDIQVFSNMNNLLKDKITDNKTIILECDSQIEIVNSKIELTKKHIAELKQNTETLIQEKRNKIEELNKQNVDNEKINQKLQSQIETLRKKVEKEELLKTNVTKLKTSISQLGKKINNINEQINFYKENDQCPTCSQKIDESFKQTVITEKQTSIENINQTINETTDKQEKINKMLQAMFIINKEITSLNQKLTESNMNFMSNLKLIDNMTKEIEGLNKKIDESENENNSLFGYNEQLQKINAQKEALINKKELFSAASYLLKDTGIKARIIKQYIPVLNKLINRYLEQMDFFCLFEMNENFEEKIKSRYRDEFSYDSFSEGEKMRINLSLLFAWREITKMRNSSATNLLILDEVMDGSLDASGMDEFLKIVVELAKANNIFIISHKTDQISDKFAHTITFEKNKNFSRIR